MPGNRWSVPCGVALAALLVGCFGKAHTKRSPATESGEELPAVEDSEGSQGSEEIASEGDLRARLPIATPSVDLLLDVLDGLCSSHEPSGAREGRDHVRDIAALVASGQIVPGSSASSPLIERLVAEREAGTACTSAGQIALIARFIDELDVSPPECERVQGYSRDRLLQAAATDLLDTPDADQTFVRYFFLTAGETDSLCRAELDQLRAALSALVNGMSTRVAIRAPQAIESQALVYRIDIRDYGWDRPIDREDIGSVDFADGWDAIVDGLRYYAVEPGGASGAEVARRTGSPVWILPAKAFIGLPESDLYYALLGQRSNLFDEPGLPGAGFSAGMLEQSPYRAGFRGLYQSEQRVTRAEVAPLGSGRAVWRFEPGLQDLFDNPLGPFGGGAFIFELANGLPGYAVADADGARLAELPKGCVEFCDRPIAVAVGAGCHECHDAGLLPVRDAVRQYAIENPAAFDPATRDVILEQFVAADDLDRIMERDNADYVAASRAAVPSGSARSITRVALEFEGHVTREVAAA